MKSELIRLKEVMDKLRSPGGCPWDAEQTHQTLLKYLLEEYFDKHLKPPNVKPLIFIVVGFSHV